MSEQPENERDDTVDEALKLIENQLLMFDEKGEPHFVEVEPIVTLNWRRQLLARVELHRKLQAAERQRDAMLAECKQIIKE